MQWLCWKCLKSMALRGVSSGNASGSRSGGCRLVVGGSGSGRGSDSGNGSGSGSGSGGRGSCSCRVVVIVVIV